MSKEEILSTKPSINGQMNDVYIEHGDALEAMQEFSDQENFRYLHMEQHVSALLSITGCKNIVEVIELFKDGKVALSFAEWATLNYSFYDESWHDAYTNKVESSYLYQYFIENIYNK